MKFIFHPTSNDTSDIPIWLVVVSLIFAPPIGVILLIIRFVWAAQDKKIKDKYGTVGTNNVKKKVKARNAISGTRLLLNVLAVLLLIAGLGSLSEAAEDPAWTLSVASVADVLSNFILSGISFGASIAHKRRAERCEIYRVLIGDNPYFSVSALAAASGVSYRRAAKDLQYMISKDQLGATSFIDVSRKMYFASPEAAAEYEKAFAKTPIEDEKQAEDKVPQDEYRKIILEIRRLNDEIADIAVSDRIYKLEEHTANIFDYVKEHPEKKSSIRMLMNYYLPTTLKLLTSYANIERVGVAGDNMRKSKESIEETLDMLVFAYKKELDRLYESESIDISSDIQVLEKMLKKDGMTKGWSDDIYSSNHGVMSEEKNDEET